MKLLLDIGNSRLKWASLDAHRIGPMQTLIHNHDAEMIAKAMQGYGRETQISIATVLSDTFKSSLSDSIQCQGFPSPHFIEVAQDRHGVHVAYSTPARLGVDRWLAMIGSRQLGPCDTIVVDCGTAATFDVLTRDGQHLGGLIIPGLSTMIRSLFERTARIPLTSSSNDFSLLATDTESAVRSGCVRALIAAIDGICDDVESTLGRPIARLLCGGDSELLMTKLRGIYRWQPDLVLQGMAVIENAL